MQTSIQDIYAAGDCCSLSLNNNFWFQKRIWGQAKIMGQRAAEIIYHNNLSALLNEIPMHFEIFSHFMRIFNLKIIMLGLYNLKNNPDKSLDVLLRMEKSKSEYIRCILKNDKMIGAIMIGKNEETFELAETFENLILNQTNLSTFKDNILNPDLDIVDYFD